LKGKSIENASEEPILEEVENTPNSNENCNDEIDEFKINTNILQSVCLIFLVPVLSIHYFNCSISCLICYILNIHNI